MQVAARSIPGSVHPYEDRVLVDEKLGLFAVADGVTRSSQGSGAVAAELALSFLRENFSEGIVPAIDKVHKIMMKRREDDMTIGETTLTAVAIHGEDLQAGNVGDSPAYLIRGRKMESLIQEDKSWMGSITQVVGYPETIKVHSTRLRLEERDMVIIASDGVGHVLNPPMMDQFVGRPNAGEIADAIVEEAKACNVGYDDDKSVIVLKVVT